MSKQDRTIDHIIPRSKGGSDLFSNLQTTHSTCNQIKNDKILDKHLKPEDFRKIAGLY